MSEVDPNQKGRPDELVVEFQTPVRNPRVPFTDPKGDSHWGIPTWVIDEHGNEVLVYREHNTGRIFPRSEPGQQSDAKG